jgi:Flp pilus assembly protein TadG
MKRTIDRGAHAPCSGARRWSFRGGSERGQALLETGLILPIVLLVSVSIFEFGRMYQTIQVMTNAAREGARVSVLATSTVPEVQDRVKDYLQAGQLGNYATANVAVNQNVTLTVGTGTASGSLVTVDYPFSFVVLNPVAKLVAPKSKLGKGVITLTATAEMRNELQ